ALAAGDRVVLGAVVEQNGAGADVGDADVDGGGSAGGVVEEDRIALDVIGLRDAVGIEDPVLGGGDGSGAPFAAERTAPLGEIDGGDVQVDRARIVQQVGNDARRERAQGEGGEAGSAERAAVFDQGVSAQRRSAAADVDCDGGGIAVEGQRRGPAAEDAGCRCRDGIGG